MKIQDEILLKFASNLKEAEIQKRAWDWADLAQGLGLDALLGAGLGAGGAALTGGGIGAGILAGLGIGTGVIPAVLSAAGVAYTIYSIVKHTDDNVDDLIERLNALDPNPRAEAIVEKWKQELGQFQHVFDIEATENDPEKRAQQLGLQIKGINDLIKYLKQIQSDWPQVKSNLTDIGFDIGQAETALNKTIQAAEKGLAEIKQKAQQEGSKLVKELGSKSGQDYLKLAKQIVDLHSQIEKTYGQAPEYEEYELPVFELAKNLLAGKAELQDINELAPQMPSLIKGLHAALAQAQKGKHAAEKPRAISKRAVHLPGQKPSQPQTGGGGTKPQAPAAPKKDPAVVVLQKSLNYLNLNLKTGIGRIAEDGDYGTNTVTALKGLLDKVPAIEEFLARKVGLDKETVLNPVFMKQNPEYLAGLVDVISAFVNAVYPKEANKENNKQNQPQSGETTTCLEDKENPRPAEILACLRGRQVKNPQTGEYNNAYEFLKNRGLRDNDIVSLIVDLFGGARSEDWSMPILVQHVSRSPRYNAFGVL